MLFIIQEEVINSGEENFIQFMDILMTGYLEGSHLIYIKPRDLKLIYSKHKELLNSKSLKALYYYEENHMIESNSLLKMINHAIKVIPNKAKEKVKLSGKITYHMLCIDNFLTTAEIQKTTLLGENIDDAKIYKIFSDYYIQNHSPNSRLLTRCRPDNGGGDTTSPTFQEKISPNEELCLTILDSDKKHPNHPIGQTAKRIKKSVSKINIKLDYVDTEIEKISLKKSTIYIDKRARELENILPYTFLKKTYYSDINKTECILAIKNLEESDHNLVYYLDFKDGLNYFHILDEVSDWHQLANTALVDSQLLTHHSQPHIDKKKCKCKVITGLGSKVLTNFISYVDGKSASELTEMINDSQKLITTIWNDIGKTVFSWCCGRNIGPTNA